MRRSELLPEDEQSLRRKRWRAGKDLTRSGLMMGLHSRGSQRQKRGIRTEVEGGAGDSSHLVKNFQGWVTCMLQGARVEDSGVQPGQGKG
jgi:hypothetical protein